MIKDFNLSKYNLENFISKLRKLDLSIPFVANVLEKESKRSNEQNALYWELVEGFAKYVGNDKEYQHDYFRYHYLYKIIEIDGHEYRQLISTTSLSTKKMAEYIDKCMQFAATEGFYLEKQ